MDNVTDYIGEDERPPATSAPNKVLRNSLKGQRRHCRPYVFNGLQFYTFTLYTLDSFNERLEKDRDHRGLAVFKNDKLIAFASGDIQQGKLDMDVAFLDGSEIVRMARVVRKADGKSRIQRRKDDIKSHPFFTDIKALSLRLRKGNLVKFSGEDAELRAKLLGFVPEFDEIYANAR